MHRTLTRFALAVGLCLVLLPPLFAYEAGGPDGYAGDPPQFHDCTACHDSYPLNSGAGGVSLLQVPTNYTPSQLYAAQVLVGLTRLSAWGFELTALDTLGHGTGVFFLDSNDSMTVNLSENPGDEPDYLTQNAAGVRRGETFGIWHFYWLAPPPGTGPVDFYIAGVGADNDSSEAGDYVFTQVRRIEPNGGGEDGPLIFIPQTGHSFGMTPLGNSRHWSFRIHNAGNEPLVFSSMSFSEGSMFHLLSGLPDPLAPHEHLVVEISFEPTVESGFLDSLVILTNSLQNGEYDYAVYGAGVHPLPPTAFDLLAPEDGEVLHPPAVHFLWQNSMNLDSTTTAVDYLLQLDTESDFFTAREFPVGGDTSFTLPFDSLEDGRIYFWRVHASDTNTSGTWSSSARAFFTDFTDETAENGAASAPTSWRLEPPHPNPFNGAVRVDVAVPQTGAATLEVVNLLGQRVALLHQGSLTAGRHTFSWQAQGASGVYLLHLEAGGVQLTRKLVYLR